VGKGGGDDLLLRAPPPTRTLSEAMHCPIRGEIKKAEFETLRRELGGKPDTLSEMVKGSSSHPGLGGRQYRRLLYIYSDDFSDSDPKGIINVC